MWQNYYATGLTYQYLCSSYTTAASCVSDQTCGWCSDVLSDFDGVCIEVDSVDPSNYISALQGSDQTKVNIQGNVGCLHLCT